jgi:hypothetical protein
MHYLDVSRLKFRLCSFTLGFVHRLQTAEHTICLAMGKTFYRGLDGAMVLYTIRACFVT